MKGSCETQIGPGQTSRTDCEIRAALALLGSFTDAKHVWCLSKLLFQLADATFGAQSWMNQGFGESIWLNQTLDATSQSLELDESSRVWYSAVSGLAAATRSAPNVAKLLHRLRQF